MKKNRVQKLFASWRRTLKNAPVENLFDTFGFDVINAKTDEKQYAMDLPRHQELRYYVMFK